jgi:hypothetical protein
LRCWSQIYCKTHHAIQMVSDLINILKHSVVVIYDAWIFLKQHYQLPTLARPSQPAACGRKDYRIGLELNRMGNLSHQTWSVFGRERAQELMIRNIFACSL